MACACHVQTLFRDYQLEPRPTLLLAGVSLRQHKTGVELNKWAADAIYGKRAFHLYDSRHAPMFCDENGLLEKGTTNGDCFRFHGVLQMMGGTIFAVNEVSLEFGFRRYGLHSIDFPLNRFSCAKHTNWIMDVKRTQSDRFRGRDI